MTNHIQRRQLLKAGLASAGLATTGLSPVLAQGSPAPAQGLNLVRKPIGRVVIVGGGFGGATAAKYLSLWGEGQVEVILVERNKDFYSCPISNLVLSGVKQIDELRQSYEGLRKRGITVIHDEVLAIDAARQTVTLARQPALNYDRLVVSPGIDFIPEAIQGLTPAAQKTVLHSWKAGAQTVALRAQLSAMPNGGTYVLSIPKAPYRCPPGPYERACQVAHYFKREKPKSKVLVLDANPDLVSKKGLFTKVWAEQYAGIVSYQPNMNVTELDLKSKTVITELGDRIRGDVLNLVPAHRAGDIARTAGLVNTNDLWCGVNWATMESTALPRVHVLGDATFSAPGMPKSGHMANQHAKTAAAAIVELLNGRTPVPLPMANTCYSFVDDRSVVHVASVHQWDAEKKTLVPVPGAGGLSKEASTLEGSYALSWAKNIWADAFA